MKAPPVIVVGLGLIGGSFARALRRSGRHVTGVDRPPVLRAALAAGAVDRAVSGLEEALREGGILVLAAPPGANLRLLRRLARTAPRDLVVTDVGSVKVPIVREARRLSLEAFVGGHPMAGAEISGFGGSTPDLFRGRPWVLTPAGESGGALAKVRALVRAAGARPVTLGAEAHDRAVAYLSHVPQLVAWALAAAARKDPVTRRHLDLAGPGFQDMTRLARSPRALWGDILRQNRTEVARALRVFRSILGGV